MSGDFLPEHLKEVVKVSKKNPNLVFNEDGEVIYWKVPYTFRGRDFNRSFYSFIFPFTVLHETTPGILFSEVQISDFRAFDLSQNVRIHLPISWDHLIKCYFNPFISFHTDNFKFKMGRTSLTATSRLIQEERNPNDPSPVKTTVLADVTEIIVG